MYKGGHTISKRKCEILCIDYNYNLSQLASGSTNGLIVIWDFDNMKIDDTLYVNHKIWGLKIDVLYIKYLNKYPFLFASYSEGICILWSVKPLRGEPILKFQNFYQTLYKLDICDVTCCLFYEDIIKDFEEKYLNKIYFVDEPEFIEERNKPRYDKTNGELLPTLTRELVEKESITDTKYDPFIKENMEIKKNISKEDIINNEEEEKENNKKENPKNEKDNHSYYLLICDKKGFIKVLNLKGIFNYYKKDIMIKRENDSNFNLLKKEDVDVEPTINHLLKNSKVRQKKTFEYPYTNLYTTRIINREWKGHSDYITDV
jgi:WD40 repeat protein